MKKVILACVVAFMCFSFKENGNLTTANVSKVVTGEKGEHYKQTELKKLTPICGAPTKKGGACKRRVRGGGRCWQHR